jgi:predicted RNA-binding Zn-ribbon protein involved in translation (DUF1610 family)
MAIKHPDDQVTALGSNTAALQAHQVVNLAFSRCGSVVIQRKSKCRGYPEQFAPFKSAIYSGTLDHRVGSDSGAT